MKKLIPLFAMAFLLSVSAFAMPSQYGMEYQRTVGPSQECCVINSVPSSNSIEYFTYHRPPENHFSFQRAFFQPPRYSYGYALAPLRVGAYAPPARTYVYYKADADYKQRNIRDDEDFVSYKRSSTRETSLRW